MSGERFWFLNTLVVVRVAHADGGDGLSVLDHRAPYEDGPPLHLHRTEDEIFTVLEGTLRVRVDGKDSRATPGTTLRVPKGVPHTYRVESPEGARFLTTTAHNDFEGLLRALGRPSASETLPPPEGPPSPDAIATLTKTAARFGIELVGPPLG